MQAQILHERYQQIQKESIFISMKDSDSQSSLQAKILDLFQINYDAINNNFDLVLDKLDYIFAQMPIADQAKILERQHQYYLCHQLLQQTQQWKLQMQV